MLGLGWVAEWSNAHAWKACLPQGNQGSNPCPSAGPFIALLLGFFGLINTATAQTRAGADSLAGAKSSFEQGNIEGAFSALQQLEREAPLTAPSLDLRGCIELEQQKFAEAVASFEAAHQADPALFAPRLHGGDALLRQQKWSEARVVYGTLMKETNILISNERLRYAVLITHLGENDEEAAKAALDRVAFPTETPAYYYASAAWAFAHRDRREAQRWIDTAREIFNPKATAWFARPLFERGWVKTKPSLVAD